MTEMRALREAAGASQAAFGAQFGVTFETYRPWDTGRRPPPPEMLARAKVLAAAGPKRLLSLPVLTSLLGVSVFRLREAARDGRVAVTYQKARWVTRPDPPGLLLTPPLDFDRRIVAVRRQLGLSQTQLAQRTGAAGKAVIGRIG